MVLTLCNLRWWLYSKQIMPSMHSPRTIAWTGGDNWLGIGVPRSLYWVALQVKLPDDEALTIMYEKLLRVPVPVGLPLRKNWYTALYSVCPFAAPQLIIKRLPEPEAITLGETVTCNFWDAVRRESQHSHSGTGDTAVVVTTVHT